ncbi:MAG: VOC family protein [Mycobacteriales bacterium]
MAVDDALAADVVAVNDTVLLQRLDALAAQRRRLDAALCGVIAEVDARCLGELVGFRSTAALLRSRLGWLPRTARARVSTAVACTAGLSPTGAERPAAHPKLAGLTWRLSGPAVSFRDHQRSHMEARMNVRRNWGGVVIDSIDPSRLARFYAAVLGFELVEDSPGWVVTQNPDGGSPLLVCQGVNKHVQHGAETAQGNRFHLDVGFPPGEQPSVAQREAEMTRLEQLGARRIEKIDVADQPVHWVWADPEGNVFCAPGV